MSPAAKTPFPSDQNLPHHSMPNPSPSKPLFVGGIEPAWRWKATYSTNKDLDRGREKTYDGSLHLWTHRDWIVLKSAKGEAIVGRHLHHGEYVAPGSEVIFHSHFALVGDCLEAPDRKSTRLNSSHAQ